MTMRRASKNARPKLRSSRLAVLLASLAILASAGAGYLRAPDSPPDRLRAELRGALADGRPFRPRLSVAAPYTSCPPGSRQEDPLCDNRREDRVRHELLAALGPASSYRSRDPDGQLAHLRGLVPLVSGTSRDGYELSIRQLERARAADPDDPEVLNDLAVAYSLRASHSRDPRDLLRAVVEVYRAGRMAPEAAAPAFNRALFLEWLGLLESASRAWERYLAAFEEPGFREEAVSALDRVRRRLDGGLGPTGLGMLAARVRRGADSAALTAVLDDLQRARELGMEHLLAAWGTAHRAGDVVTTERLLDSARRLGAAIAERHGECSVSSMAEAIDRAHGDAPALDRLAQAHLAFAEGAHLLRALRSDDAKPRFELAARLTAADHPVHLWSRMGLWGARFYRHDHEAATAGFRDLRSAAGDGCLHALAGRAAWGLGLTRLRQGRYTTALTHFWDAESLFRELEEAENLGAVRTLIGETHVLLGRPELAWASWLSALHSLGRYPGSLRLHNLLWTMGRTAAPELGPKAALILQEEGVRTAHRSGDRGLLAEALLWRGRFHAAAGDLDRALADLDRAARENRRRPTGPAPAQVAADLRLARGIVLARRDGAAALGHLSAALDYYRDEGLVLPQPEALLERARILRSHGSPRQALGDLEASLDLFRDQRSAIADDHLRRSFTEWVQAAFEEALDLLAEDLGAAPEETLRLAEEARDVPFLWGGSPAAPSGSGVDPLPALHRALDREGGGAIVAYASTPSHLHVWLVHGGRVGAVRKPVPRRYLEARIWAFVEAARTGESLDALAAESAALHRLLVPPGLAELPPATPLFVVPDRILSALPFDLLRDPSSGRLLVERGPFALAPSLRLLAASLDPTTRHPAWPLTATLVVDPAHDLELFPALPRLGRARDEARRIGDLYGDSELLTGAAATPEAFLAALDRRPVLHYAGHAVFNPVDPTLSYLPLAPAQAGEGESTLFARDLNAHPLRRLRLVVLSACTTLGPTSRRTAAISGVARPFLDAGASAVVGTLWPVFDDEAARILPDFHRRFLATGDAAYALWQTKLAILAKLDPTHDRSARWAAFQLVGQARFPNGSQTQETRR